MRLLDEAKQFFWLRRIALASERQADSLERIVKFLEAEQLVAQQARPRRKSEFSVVDQEAINADWLRRTEAERDGVELED